MGIALLRWIDRYLIKTQIWVSLNCAALATIASLRFQFESFQWTLIVCLFFIAFSGYHFYMIHPNNNFKKFVRQSHFIAAFIGVIGVVLCLAIEHRLYYQKRLYSLAGLTVLSILYNSPILNISLRKVPYFKIMYISLMWSLWISLFVLETFNGIAFWALFFFVFAITIPFDIRDSEEGEKTIVNELGVDNSLYLSLVLLWLSYFFWIKWEFEFMVSILFLVPFLFFSVILLKVNTGKSKWENDFYINFYVEGIPMILLLYFALLYFVIA